MAEFGEILSELEGGLEGLEESGEILTGTEASASVRDEVNALMGEIFGDLPDLPEPGEDLADLKKENTTLENEAKDAAKEVKELKNVTAEIDLWEKPAKFGKWVGVEIGKGALFVVGMKAVEAVFTAAAKPATGTPSKQSTEASKQAKASKAAMDEVEKILDA